MPPTEPTPVQHDVDVELPDDVGSIRRVAVATDADDASLTHVRRVALALARSHGFDVVLYDRSGERWTDHPHPEGPLRADELEGADREHLVRQLHEFEAEGVEASAWLATVPALTAMLDVIQSLDVDAVMLPERLDAPKLGDRLQIGSTPPEMVQRIAELNLQRPPVVLAVPEAGPITIVDGPVRG